MTASPYARDLLDIKPDISIVHDKIGTFWKYVFIFNNGIVRNYFQIFIRFVLELKTANY